MKYRAIPALHIVQRSISRRSRIAVKDENGTEIS
jgi:hypothetical protein